MSGFFDFPASFDSFYAKKAVLKRQREDANLNAVTSEGIDEAALVHMDKYFEEKAKLLKQTTKTMRENGQGIASGLLTFFEKTKVMFACLYNSDVRHALALQNKTQPPSPAPQP